MIKDIIEMMNELINDRSVPKNVRTKIEEAINDLSDKKTEKIVRIGKVISVMDSISNDTNLPVYSRTKLWNIVSMLEKERAKI